MKKIFFILITALLFVFNVNAQEPTTQGKTGIIDASKITYNIFTEFSMLEVEFFKNGEGELRNKNISTFILGLSTTLPLSKKLT
jgi:hypothetical protein